jgi:ferredoxin
VALSLLSCSLVPRGTALVLDGAHSVHRRQQLVLPIAGPCIDCSGCVRVCPPRGGFDGMAARSAGGSAGGTWRALAGDTVQVPVAKEYTRANIGRCEVMLSCGEGPCVLWCLWAP